MAKVESLEFSPDRVRLVRALLRLSRREFAKRYDVGINTVVRLESESQYRPGSKVLGALLQAARDAGA